MTDNRSTYPSIEEMEARIMRNILRLQGYLDVLRSEIDDPEKEGPESSKETWIAATKELNRNIEEFRALIESKSREEPK